MNTRLQRFILAEDLTQSQFADSINVARASISHIISGRNKPGFDFVEKLIKTYPDLNIEWLITGKGRMYKSKSEPNSPSATINEDNSDILFPEESEEEERIEPVYNAPAPAPTPASTPVPAAAKTKAKANNTESDCSKQLDKPTEIIVNQRSIRKIIVFFDDNSFQEYSPA